MQQAKRSNNFGAVVNRTAILEAIIIVILVPSLLFANDDGGISVLIFTALVVISFITGVVYIIIALNNWNNGRVENGAFIRQLILSILIAAFPLLFSWWMMRGLGC